MIERSVFKNKIVGDVQYTLNIRDFLFFLIREKFKTNYRIRLSSRKFKLPV